VSSMATEHCGSRGAPKLVFALLIVVMGFYVVVLSLSRSLAQSCRFHPELQF